MKYHFGGGYYVHGRTGRPTVYANDFERSSSVELSRPKDEEILVLCFFKNKRLNITESNSEMGLSKTRTQRALDAKDILSDDFFGGWRDEDTGLFNEFATTASPLSGMITDFLGTRTATEFHPWATHLNGTLISNVPIPDDNLRAEAIEYFALLYSLKNTKSATFRMAEIGASYAPWACISAVIAKRRGLSFDIVAVEASPLLFDQISIHLRNNGIDPHSRQVRMLNAVVAAKRGYLLFPKVSNFGENGGQAVSARQDTDYVGRSVEYEQIKAVTLAEDILHDQVFDFLHIDIQGAEFDVVSSSINVLNEQVRNIFVGTHSRLIEGQLLELLHKSGWELIRERPTKFSYHRERESIIGWTTRDGGQFWSNPRLS